MLKSHESHDPAILVELSFLLYGVNLSLLLTMVTCTRCNKSFKKLQGLSLHRNKCGSTLSGPIFEQNLSDSRSRQKKYFAIKFSQREESVLQPQASADLEIFDDEPDPVRNLLC